MPDEPQTQSQPQEEPFPAGDKDPVAVNLGRKGGQAGHGKKKARSHEQASRAAKTRWEKQKRTHDGL